MLFERGARYRRQQHAAAGDVDRLETNASDGMGKKNREVRRRRQLPRISRHLLSLRATPARRRFKIVFLACGRRRRRRIFTSAKRAPAKPGAAGFLLKLCSDLPTYLSALLATYGHKYKLRGRRQKKVEGGRQLLPGAADGRRSKTAAGSTEKLFARNEITSVTSFEVRSQCGIRIINAKETILYWAETVLRRLTVTEELPAGSIRRTNVTG